MTSRAQEGRLIKFDSQKFTASPAAQRDQSEPHRCGTTRARSIVMGKTKAPVFVDDQKRDDKLVNLIGHDRRALGKDGEIEIRSLNYGEFDGEWHRL